VTGENLSAIEKRVLAYLDQRGPTHRSHVVCDLASPDSRIGRNGGRHNGSNGATPLIMGKWCKRLLDQGLVREVRQFRTSYYQHHEITDLGRALLREPRP
jgi:DNA-binding MarR family transcriptional regulator